MADSRRTLAILTFDDDLRTSTRAHAALSSMVGSPRQREDLLRETFRRSPAVATELFGAPPQDLAATPEEAVRERARLIVRAHFASRPLELPDEDAARKKGVVFYPSPIWHVTLDGQVRRGLVALDDAQVKRFYRTPLVTHGTAALVDFLVERVMGELADPARLLARIVDSIEFFTAPELPMLPVHPFGHAADFIVSATFAHLLRVVGFGDLALVEETLAEDSGAHEVPMIEQLHELERENYAAFVPYS